MALKVQSNGVAVTVTKLFSRETAISVNIRADKNIIWALLTNADEYPRWNTAVISIQGEIYKNETIWLKTIVEPRKQFIFRIRVLKPESRMVWSGVLGSRIFTLERIGPTLINFTMREKISGLFFPFFARMIPSFDESFERFANDLKVKAEMTLKTR